MALINAVSTSTLAPLPVGEIQLADGEIRSGHPSSVTSLSGALGASASGWFGFVPGTPMAADPSSPGNRTSRLVTGDLNNDGYPDIAAAHGYRTAGLYLNNGDQSFAPEAVLSESWWPVSQNIGATSIALGDLDLDGNLDLVIPIYGDHYIGRNIQLYRGLGDGSFTPWPVDNGIIMSSGANPMFAGIADFNGDGRPDVVVSHNNGGWPVDVLTQAANGSFSVSDSDRAGQNPQYFDLADFNEDGAPDVVVGALYSGVLVFLNDANGLGTLHREGGTYLSPQHHYVVAADFNGDGHKDIAARGNVDALISILFGDGTGNFPSTASFTVGGIDGYLAVADINNDGASDLVVASTSTKSVDLLLNDGNGHFGAAISTVLTAEPWGVAVDDFDQDGWADVAVSRSDNTIQILWNTGRIDVKPASFTLVENSSANTLVGTVIASGEAPLSFAITAGNSDPDGDNHLSFAINPTTGVITVNDSGDLDYETTPQFNLQVTATDTNGLSDTAPVTVTLINVDEPGNERPEAQDATFTIPENSANGTAVGIVTATDVDAGDTLTYAITAGNGNPDGDSQFAFGIDSSTGEVIVNDSDDLDFKSTPTFNLSVTVTDSGGLFDAASLTINLSDSFEQVGTPGDDVLLGTFGNDVLNGLAGDDTLSGGAGNDTLNGGDGIDRIKEQGDVNFTLSDLQLIGLGTDALISIERASLSGGSGNNTLNASAFTRGAVALSGGAGDDHLIGPREAGTCRFTGGPGNDTFTGGIGCDALVEVGDTNFTLGATQLTGNGTDSFTSMDIAYLIGGQGNNRLDVTGFTGSHTILDGRGGNDTLVGGVAYDWVRSQADSDFTLSDRQLIGNGIDTLIGIDAAILIGGGSANTLDVSAFTGHQTILEGGGGDDTLIGRTGGLDRVRARGDVDFTLTNSQLTGQGTDQLTAIDEAVLIGGSSANTLDVSAFTGALTILEGGGGDDTLIGRTGGLDRVRARGDVNFTLTNSQLTGQGTDSLLNIDQAQLIGDGSANTLDASAFTQGSVFLYGESGDDTLRGGHGNDHLEGGSGDDILSGGAGRDRIVGRGDTNFTLTAKQLSGLGTDSFDGIEDALLIGGPGANTLDGSGFTGALVIYEGKAGDDIYIGRATGSDCVRARGDADFTLTNSQLTGLGTDSLQDIDQAQLIGYSGSNRFDASAFTLGPVALNAGSGNDTLIGGGGKDTLIGGSGLDLLTGGGGNDSLTGGSGADRFRFSDPLNAASNRDTITDFSVAQGDSIELENSVFTAFAGAGAFDPAAFAVGASATTSAQCLLYDSASGLLSYDADGNGAGASIAFAQLTPGLALSSAQFVVI
ncbi:FG-GAP-like repeat-containing protein [Cyanobium sp. Morenito 9A2]|uniref:FG-GAP-like repeat-containing protein n=1 Tax=Cyanobium sp. Morenito 9A2 TaxID=2823718 RepID=UPI0020CDECDD|nr:FG-GAP-like repeat-containing protein [Cyanobium sp. Morenito 9A2]MCP9850478.1 VCBS repeat-containing protein [Cyanobium sp. Morenito 9A2]